MRTTRRVAVGLTMSIAVALLMMTTWGGSRSALFFRAVILGLSGTEIAKSAGGFFFVWALWALGGLGGLTFVLSVRGLWRLRPGQPR